MNHFYERFGWWDILLHGVFGLVVGIFGVMLLSVLNEKETVYLSLSPFFICAFAFMFALTLGTLWEVFEFSCDQFFGLNMQKWQDGYNSGLIDTMEDLIIGGLGALIAVSFAYLAFKKNPKELVLKMEKTFLIADHKTEKGKENRND